MAESYDEMRISHRDMSTRLFRCHAHLITKASDTAIIRHAVWEFLFNEITLIVIPSRPRITFIRLDSFYPRIKGRLELDIARHIARDILQDIKKYRNVSACHIY